MVDSHTDAVGIPQRKPGDATAPAIAKGTPSVVHEYAAQLPRGDCEEMRPILPIDHRRAAKKQVRFMADDNEREAWRQI